MSERPKSWRGRRNAWLAGAAVVVAASAAHAEVAYPIALEAGGLEPSLIGLARQTKQQIMFSKTLVAGRAATALRGRFTPEAALARLLAGTGLRARRVSASMVVVEPIGAGADGDRRPFGDDPATGATGGVDGTVLLDEVKVTGSNLRGAPSAAPLVALSRADLERSGRTTVAEALRSLPANYGGGASEGGGISGGDRVGRNTGYGTSLNLRGLGSNATLVLVNGRRIAGSGLFGDFADLSGIPAIAVKRVEVLLDGASAVYGSDAVGGVVNIILRDDVDGGEARALAGVGTAGEPREGQASLAFGRRWAGGGLTLAYELQRRDALPADTRAFAADADLRAVGGHDYRSLNGFPGNVLVTDPVTRALVPGYAVPAGQSGVGLRPGDFQAGVVNRSNPRAGVDILPRQTLNAVYAALDQAVGDRVTLTADARYSHRRFRARNPPAIATFTVSNANPFFVSPTGAASQAMTYSFVGDLPNPVVNGAAEGLALTLGARARLGRGWGLEGYGAFAQSIDENRTFGLVHSLRLAEALGGPDRPETAFRAPADGYFNPFVGVPGANLPGVLAHIASGFAVNRTRDRVATVSLQADGPLWTLPGGPLQLAVGAQARKETLLQVGANFTSTPAPTPQAGADVSRTVSAGFAELRAPLVGDADARPGLRRLELSLAGRVEHYEALGTTANPKAGLLYAPAEDLTLRATYGRSFRAPALRETSDLPRYSPSVLPEGAARIQTLVLGGGNPDLTPETARTWTLGADWAPRRWPGLSVSASLYDIRFRDRIDRPAQANLANALTDPTLATFVTRISPGTRPADRALIQGFIDSGFVSGTANLPAEAYQAIVDNRYVNTATLRLRGLDLSGRYRLDLADGELAVGAQATFVFDFRQQLTPTSVSAERAGRLNYPVRWRGRTSADWTRGGVTLGAALNYTDSYRDPAGARIAELTTLDLQARWAGERGAWRGVSVLLNLRNAFDQGPPFYDNPLGIAYDGALGDPVGRFVSLQIARRW